MFIFAEKEVLLLLWRMKDNASAARGGEGSSELPCPVFCLWCARSRQLACANGVLRFCSTLEAPRFCTCSDLAGPDCSLLILTPGHLGWAQWLSQGYHNKLPQTGRFKQQNFFSLSHVVLEPEAQTQGVGQAGFPRGPSPCLVDDCPGCVFTGSSSVPVS